MSNYFGDKDLKVLYIIKKRLPQVSQLFYPFLNRIMYRFIFHSIISPYFLIPKYILSTISDYYIIKKSTHTGALNIYINKAINHPNGLSPKGLWKGSFVPLLPPLLGGGSAGPDCIIRETVLSSIILMMSGLIYTFLDIIRLDTSILMNWFNDTAQK
jgi:hypothetical protein